MKRIRACFLLCVLWGLLSFVSACFFAVETNEDKGRGGASFLPFGQRKRKRFLEKQKFYPLQKFPLYFCGE